MQFPNPDGSILRLKQLEVNREIEDAVAQFKVRAALIESSTYSIEISPDWMWKEKISDVVNRIRAKYDWIL